RRYMFERAASSGRGSRSRLSHSSTGATVFATMSGRPFAPRARAIHHEQPIFRRIDRSQEAVDRSREWRRIDLAAVGHDENAVVQPTRDVPQSSAGEPGLVQRLEVAAVTGDQQSTIGNGIDQLPNV